VTSFTRDCIRWEYRNFNMMANRSSPGTVNDAVNTIHIRHTDAGRDMALGDIAEWGGANWATITVPLLVRRRADRGRYHAGREQSLGSATRVERRWFSRYLTSLQCNTLRPTARVSTLVLQPSRLRKPYIYICPYSHVFQLGFRGVEALLYLHSSLWHLNTEASAAL